MAGRPKIKRDDKLILETYQAFPTVLGVAKRLHVDRRVVRESLVRQGIQLGTVDVVADSIIKRMEKNPEMFSKNFEQLSAVLGSSNVVGVLRSPEKYKETVVEQARTALLLALSALITQDKLSLATPSAIAQVVPVLAEIASGKYQLGAGKQEVFDGDKIIESIQIQLKRIRSFNPVMAKETEETIQQFIDLPTKSVKVKKEGV